MPFLTNPYMQGTEHGEELPWPIDASSIAAPAIAGITQSSPISMALRNLYSRLPKLFHSIGTGKDNLRLPERGVSLQSPLKSLYRNEVGSLSTSVSPYTMSGSRNVVSISNPYAAEQLVDIITPQAQEELTENIIQGIQPYIRPREPASSAVWKINQYLHGRGVRGIIVGNNKYGEDELRVIDPDLFLNPYQTHIPPGQYNQYLRRLEEKYAPNLHLTDEARQIMKEYEGGSSALDQFSEDLIQRLTGVE